MGGSGALACLCECFDERQYSASCTPGEARAAGGGRRRGHSPYPTRSGAVRLQGGHTRTAQLGRKAPAKDVLIVALACALRQPRATSYSLTASPSPEQGSLERTARAPQREARSWAGSCCPMQVCCKGVCSTSGGPQECELAVRERLVRYGQWGEERSMLGLGQRACSRALQDNFPCR